MAKINKNDRTVEELVRQIFEEPRPNINSFSAPGTPCNIFSVTSLPMNHPLRERAEAANQKIYISSDAPLKTQNDKITLLRTELV